MAAVKVDPGHVREFASSAAFEAWLSEHHDKADEIWIRIHNVNSCRRALRGGPHVGLRRLGPD